MAARLQVCETDREVDSAVPGWCSCSRARLPWLWLWPRPSAGEGALLGEADCDRDCSRPPRSGEAAGDGERLPMPMPMPGASKLSRLSPVCEWLSARSLSARSARRTCVWCAFSR